MNDDRPLLPPIDTPRERLTKNQRERYLLRSLLRLVIRAEEYEQRIEGNETRPRRAGGSN